METQEIKSVEDFENEIDKIEDSHLEEIFNSFKHPGVRKAVGSILINYSPVPVLWDRFGKCFDRISKNRLPQYDLFTDK